MQGVVSVKVLLSDKTRTREQFTKICYVLISSYSSSEKELKKKTQTYFVQTVLRIILKEYEKNPRDSSNYSERIREESKGFFELF